MRVVVPFAANQERGHIGLYPETVEALDKGCPVTPDYRDVSGDPEAYFRLLSELWADASDDLVLVEHDIVPHYGVWRQFQRCKQVWCSFPYQMGARVRPGLGCTRFRKEMLAAVPWLWQRVAEHGNGGRVEDGMPPRHWVRLDVRMDAELIPMGYSPHVHQPPVQHLNPAQQPS